MKNRRWLIFVLVMLGFIVLGIIYCLHINHADDEIIFANEEDITSSYNDELADFASITEEEENSIDITEESGSICVYICGSVKEPGVYYLDHGMRINDAVTAAGGFSENAAKEYINLAQIISDGDMVYIPDKDVLEEDVKNDINGFQKGYMPDGAADGLIDINVASKDELLSLPGIGDVKADAIIGYREQNGAFSSIEELINVKGIGKASFEKIKEFIKV